MENKKTFPTVLTHFFNLTTTPTKPENLKTEVSTRRTFSATGLNLKTQFRPSLLITKWGAGGERSDNPANPRSGLEVLSQRSRRERSERTERVCGAKATSFFL